MKATEITDLNYKETLQKNSIVMIDFWAEWCGPCKAIGPVIEELAVEYEETVMIGKLNVDDNSNTTAEYGIRSIPTILFFKDGELVDKQVGAVNKSVLKEKLNKIIESSILPILKIK